MQQRAKHVTSANSDKIVTLVGGSGFVGRQILRSLAKRGYRIRVACARPDLSGPVQPLGTTGQVMALPDNGRNHASAAAAWGRDCAVADAPGLVG